MGFDVAPITFYCCKYDVSSGNKVFYLVMMEVHERMAHTGLELDEAAFCLGNTLAKMSCMSSSP